jgi:hypothetical protein
MAERARRVKLMGISKDIGKLEISLRLIRLFLLSFLLENKLFLSLENPI